jgi:hypothetical protein
MANMEHLPILYDGVDPTIDPLKRTGGDVCLIGQHVRDVHRIALFIKVKSYDLIGSILIRLKFGVIRSQVVALSV